MKTTAKKTVMIMVIILLMAGCSKKSERNPEFLPLMEIDIPRELAGNKETVEFIKASESAINEFSDRIEELAIDGKDIFNKKEADLTVMDKLKLGKLAVQFVTNSSQMLNELNKVEGFVEKAKQNGLDESQIKSLEVIEKSMEERINQVNKKYEHYFDQ